MLDVLRQRCSRLVSPTSSCRRTSSTSCSSRQRPAPSPTKSSSCRARRPAACSTRGSSPGSWRSTWRRATRRSTTPRPRPQPNRSKRPTPKPGRRRRPRCRTSRSSNRPRSATWSELEVPTPSDAELRAQHEAGTEDVRSRVQLPHILVETEAEAEAILDQLEGGADFAELAASESIDTWLGCQRRKPAVRPEEQLRIRLCPRVRGGGTGSRDRRAGRARQERVRVPHHRPATIGSGRPHRVGNALYTDVTQRFQRADAGSTSTSTRGSVCSTRRVASSPSDEAPMSDRPRVVVAGLGPGGPEHVTAETLAEIERVPHRFLRTRATRRRHLVPDAGHVRRGLRGRRHVRRRLRRDRRPARRRRRRARRGAVRRAGLAAGARTHRAVTPSPTTASSAACCRRCRSSTSRGPRLGIDPVEHAVRLIDGHEFAIAAAGDTGPLLVAHTHANWVLSDIKLGRRRSRRRLTRTGGASCSASARPTRRSSTRHGPSSTARSRPTT